MSATRKTPPAARRPSSSESIKTGKPRVPTSQSRQAPLLPHSRTGSHRPPHHDGQCRRPPAGNTALVSQRFSRMVMPPFAVHICCEHQNFCSHRRLATAAPKTPHETAPGRPVLRADSLGPPSALGSKMAFQSANIYVPHSLSDATRAGRPRFAISVQWARRRFSATGP